jgi:hypothetical protein
VARWGRVINKGYGDPGPTRSLANSKGCGTARGTGTCLGKQVLGVLSAHVTEHTEQVLRPLSQHMTELTEQEEA